MERIYLAIPYSVDARGQSEEDRARRESRYFIANKVAGQLILEGNAVFSPISHSHPISLTMPDGAWDTDCDLWYTQDLTYIKHWATALYVVCIDGWHKSTGVLLEIEEAKKLGLPIVKIDEQGGLLNICLS